jgi:hypothetical protein
MWGPNGATQCSMPEQKPSLESAANFCGWGVVCVCVCVCVCVLILPTPPAQATHTIAGETPQHT